jgi:hypothetical protein
VLPIADLRPLAQWSLELGGHCRTGMEDNVRLDRDTLAPSNAALVQAVANLCQRHRRHVASAREARAILGHRHAEAPTPASAVVSVTQTQYTAPRKSAVIPQIRVEPELRAELESVLRQGETLTDFVEATVRSAIAFRRVQTSFHARAQAASQAYHQTGISVPVESVLDRLQSKLDARRKLRGGTALDWTPPARLQASDPEALVDLAITGAGVLQVALHHVVAALRAGQLKLLLGRVHDPDEREVVF